MRLRVTFIHYGKDPTIMPNVLVATDEYMEDAHGSVPPYYTDMLDESSVDDGVRECFIEVPDSQILALFATPSIEGEVVE